MVAFVGYATAPAVGYARIAELSVATRYRTPEFVRIGPDDDAAIAWLAAHIRPGERVFNSPNDGSTYLYVERGIPVVNIYTLGLTGIPYTYRLLQIVQHLPDGPRGPPPARRPRRAVGVRRHRHARDRLGRVARGTGRARTASGWRPACATSTACPGSPWRSARDR